MSEQQKPSALRKCVDCGAVLGHCAINCKAAVVLGHDLRDAADRARVVARLNSHAELLAVLTEYIAASDNVDDDLITATLRFENARTAARVAIARARSEA